MTTLVFPFGVPRMLCCCCCCCCRHPRTPKPNPVISVAFRSTQMRSMILCSHWPRFAGGSPRSTPPPSPCCPFKTVSPTGEADYRYFPEPDIPPLALSAELLQKWRSELCELPGTFRSRGGITQHPRTYHIKSKRMQSCCNVAPMAARGEFTIHGLPDQLAASSPVALPQDIIRSILGIFLSILGACTRCFHLLVNLNL